MKMKTKLAKIALAAFVGIAAPSWGAEGKIAVFNDDGLANPHLKNISQPEEGIYIAKIAGITEGGDTELHRIPLSEVQVVGWQNDDAKHLAYKKIHAVLDLKSGNELDFGTITLQQQYPYTIQKQPSEVTEGKWFPLGETRTTYSLTEYQRPDKSIFVDKKVLYTKAMEEIARNPMSPLNSYRGEEVRTTYQGGFLRKPGGTQTTRYFWNQSDQTSITVKITTTFPDGRKESEQGSIIKVENTHAISGDYGDGAIKLDQLDPNKYWIV